MKKKKTTEILHKFNKICTDLEERKTWLTRFIKKNGKFLNTYYILLSWDYNLVINVASPEELHKVRQELKKTLKWSDKIKQVWTASQALVSYESEKYPYIQIWLEMEPKKLEDFLNRGKDKSCKFIETTNKSLNYVCEVRNE